MNTSPAAAADFEAFCAMIRVSWAYGRMTDAEQTRCIDALRWALDNNAVKGCQKTRWNILHAVFRAFLMGLGYTDGNWREPEDSDAPLF